MYKHKSPQSGTVCEIGSGISALNMPPEPIPGATGYLSDIDAMAKHACEHFEAAHQLAVESQQQMERLRSMAERLCAVCGHEPDTLEITFEETLVMMKAAIESIQLLRRKAEHGCGDAPCGECDPPPKDTEEYAAPRWGLEVAHMVRESADKHSNFGIE